MSLPGKDLRQEISAEVHAVLKAYAETHDMEMREVVNQILGDWADKKVHLATVMHNKLVVAGVIPERAVARRNVKVEGETS